MKIAGAIVILALFLGLGIGLLMFWSFAVYNVSEIMLRWALGALILFFTLGWVFGKIHVLFGSELQGGSESWQSTWPPWSLTEPWELIIAFTTGSGLNSMKKSLVYAGFGKARENSCPECQETLAIIAEAWWPERQVN